MTAKVCLLAAALYFSPVAVYAQDERSPDLQTQQPSHSQPPPQSHDPGAQQTPQSGAANSNSADAEKGDKTGGKTGEKTKKSKKTHQAHGTPDPNSSSDNSK